jgi:streptogramin lyase
MSQRPRGLRVLVLGLAVLGVSMGSALPASAEGVQIRSWPIPTPDSEPIEITLGPDGNLWFTEQNGNAVARVTPRGVITEFTPPTFSFPGDITAGPDGNVWFTEGSNGRIARISPDGRIREFVFDEFGSASGITTGPDGNIWFTASPDQVWRFTLATKTFTSFETPTADSFPGDITAGSDGNLWFVEQGVGRIARITPAGVVTEFDEPLELPFAITTGPDGNVWFTERFNQRIGKVTPGGDFTFYTTVLHTLDSIVSGPGDRLWFTSFGDDRVANITTDGVITPMPEVPNSGPTGISPDSRGRIWFLGYSSNRVYRLKL